MLSQMNNGRCFLTKGTKLPLLTVPEKQEDMLQLMDAVVSMNLSKKANIAKAMLSEMINRVRYIYNAVLCSHKRLRKTVAVKELAEAI